MNIPHTVFENISRWMCKGPWLDHLQLILDEHLHVYCDQFEIDSFEELGAKIGDHWVSALRDVAFMDFLSRETEDGNIVEAYLKKAGRNKERVITKAYLQGIQGSVMSLYEVSDIRPGISFLAQDLILGGDPILVEEKSATQTLAPWDYIAARIVDVRGHSIIAGAVLPFERKLAHEMIQHIHMMADTAELAVEEMFDESETFPEDDVIRSTALNITLAIEAPMFSQIWLEGTNLDASQTALPSLCNSDGEDIEFIHLHYPVLHGITHLEISDIINRASGMELAGDDFWNWIDDTPANMLGKPPQTEGLKVGSQSFDGKQILGTLELKERKLKALTNSVARAQRLQANLDNLLQGLVGIPLKEHQTAQQAFKEHQRNPHRSPEPANLSEDEEAEIVKAFMDQHYSKTLDEPVGMLNNKTPRQAARSKAGKLDVVNWIKYLENQTVQQNGNSQQTYDFTWMWEELSLLHLRR